MVKLFWRSLFLFSAFGVAYLLFWPIPIDPEAYEPAPDPGLSGAFAPNNLLGNAQRLILPEGADGPEDFAVLPDGLYTADVNGGLFRLEGENFIKIADLGGRPLGLDEGPDGALYIADSFRGLMRWTKDDGLTSLVTEIDGDPVVYANQLDVARDGTIYFSNSTDRFDPETLGGTKPTSVMTIFEQSRTGYVARRTPDGTVEKIATGFVYTNGVVLSPDERYLLIAESGRVAIHKLWLTGDREGQLEPFLTSLPGYPANLEPGEDGTFWVAFASPRVPAEALMPYPFLRKVVWRLGPYVRPAPIEHGMVAQYDSEGKVLRVLQDANGTLGITTGARVIGDHLHVTMLEGPFAARVLLDSPRRDLD
ncbi:SMP-30/gluconolactonase/LRE family protein [uncultured Roseobacter sp.]|uniref:SMP-30/gluconolactonase/LRE family protein n=1 Tax=uncultured Roseobacter sp. TaxID=114847 RepID=UPI0026049137|nr:SMP-30/gluconolactonase/LRE family protein [uncultured Roseobacter sp.]